MFTGLVGDVGTVAAVDATADGVRLTLATHYDGELREGDSVAVGGVCLTAAAVAAGSFAADVMRETLRRSTLGALQVGVPVNLELALRAGDRLGGHIVQGHVDGVGTVAAVRDDGLARVLSIAEDAPGLLRYVVHKGSIAVDGVSLTVARIDERGFDVSLIPETLASTTLGALAAGDVVNIETDILARHVERMLAFQALDGRNAS